MINRLTPQEIADKLRKCANGGGCSSCPWACGDGSCIRSIMRAAAEALDNQRAHVQALIKSNEAHREMVARPAKRSDMVAALDAIETGMTKVAIDRDIWQNDLIYVLCQGVRLLLEERVRK
mgnify:CR=1 FL=1